MLLNVSIMNVLPSYFASFADERMNLAFAVLPCLFGGRKQKGGRASTKETMDGFIDLQKVKVNLEQQLSNYFLC